MKRLIPMWGWNWHIHLLQRIFHLIDFMVTRQAMPCYHGPSAGKYKQLVMQNQAFKGNSIQSAYHTLRHCFLPQCFCFSLNNDCFFSPMFGKDVLAYSSAKMRCGKPEDTYWHLPDLVVLGGRACPRLKWEGQGWSKRSWNITEAPQKIKIGTTL